MPSLKTFVQKSTVGINESNLERGRVWNFTATSAVGSPISPGNFCWCAPASGTVIIESWAPSGSGSMMCCCGYGLPGNPGSYGKKTITVTTGCWITGCVGSSCGNASALEFRGCSGCNVVCWCTGASVSCMCQQGGRSGYTACVSGSSMYCCYISAWGFCNTLCSTGCGIICNIGSSYTFIPSSSGGDINCSGGISCTIFNHCNPCCYCCHIQVVKLAPNIISQCGARVVFSVDNNVMGLNGSASVGFIAQAQAISGMGRNPEVMPYSYCWASVSACGCYEAYGCLPVFGAGVPGGAAIPLSSIRDHGIRGGHGRVKIQFIPS